MARASDFDLEISVDAYCTFADVEAVLPQRPFTAHTKPTRAQALDFCRSVYDRINGMLDILGYQIPVASGNGTSVSILRSLNVDGAAAEIEAATYSMGNLESSDYARFLQDRFSMKWKVFEKGSISLPGAARQGNYFPRADEKQPAYSFDPDSLSNEEDPTFTKDMDF